IRPSRPSLRSCNRSGWREPELHDWEPRGRSDMDLHRSVPSSALGEGDFEPVGHPAPAPVPAPAGGVYGRKDHAPASPPSSRTACAQPPRLGAVAPEPAPARAPAVAAAVEAKDLGATRFARLFRGRWARRRFDLPAWSVSLMVHVVILSALGAATFSTEVRRMAANMHSALGCP